MPASVSVYYVFPVSIENNKDDYRSCIYRITDRERGRQRDRRSQTDRERDKQKDRQNQTVTETERQRQRQRYARRETEAGRQTDTHLRMLFRRVYCSLI